MKYNGLNDIEVNTSKKRYGTNEINYENNHSFLKIFLESLGDPIIKILLIALGIKILLMFQDTNWYETLGIVISILIASLVSTISEYGSEAAFKRLQEDASKINVKVIRNSKITSININEIVVGDILLLSSGDLVPADGELISGELKVNESTLTGEMKSIRKYLSYSADDNSNQLYRGTVVDNGQATIKITKVGKETNYGKIAQEVSEGTPISPLKIRLTKLAKKISLFGYIGAIIVSLSYLFSNIVIANNFNVNDIINTITNFRVMANYLLYALTLGVTILIVAIPEGLPMMITLVLSVNMKKMIKENVLVRRLVGIETSGSMNILLSDKTGTLTKGNLKVLGYMSPEFNYYNKFNEIVNLNEILSEGIILNNECQLNTETKIVMGNITDKAIKEFTNKHQSFNEIINRIIFTSENKYSLVSTINRTYIKGAPEVILNYCNKIIKEDGNPAYKYNLDQIKKEIDSGTTKGFRVIALAYSDTYHVTKKLSNFAFCGLLFIKDEIRSTAKNSIETLNKAGIKVIMTTGDELKTAKVIGQEVGLYQEKDIALDSKKFNELNDNEVIKLLPNLSILARCKPLDKSRLVKILQSQNQVVGMTGDGVNDAAALSIADVGFAMGSGSEVSKSAADIVILDDNIASICNAVLYGRTIYKSIKKFIVFQLTINICAMLLAIIGPFIGINTPVTIIQMLWVNMIMDTLAGVAFAFEPALKKYLEEVPKNKNEEIIDKPMINQIISMGSYMSLICILFLKLDIFKHLVRVDNNYKYLMTAYFMLFIFMSLFNAFNARTERLNLLANIKKNKAFMIIIGSISIMQIYLVYFGKDLFRSYGLTVFEFILVILISFSVIPIDIFRKYLYKNKITNKKA